MVQQEVFSGERSISKECLRSQWPQVESDHHELKKDSISHADLDTRHEKRL